MSTSRVGVGIVGDADRRTTLQGVTAMTMLRRILVPLDGSGAAEEILLRLAGLLRGEETEIILMHALRSSDGLGEYAAQARSVARELREAYLSAVSTRMDQEGVSCELIVREGAPAQTILDYAMEIGATLVALSTHGASGASRWLLGSVCEKVARRSPVPVLASRVFTRHATEFELKRVPRAQYSFARILVPLDGSEASLVAVPRAVELARACGGEIVLLHVYEEDYADEPSQLEWLNAERDGLREQGLRARALVKTGQPVAEIERAAVELNAGLIAMASQGRRAFSEWLLGSVAERVLRLAPTPVLLVPAAGTALAR